MPHRIVPVVEPIARRIADETELELVDIDFVKAGAGRILRVLVDKPGGVTVDDCERFSEPFSRALDEADPIAESYYLEVSSPGLDRPLKSDRDFARFKGERIQIKLTETFEGTRALSGVLNGFEEGCVLLLDGDKERRVPQRLIRRAALMPEF